jgi:TolB-like protein
MVFSTKSAGNAVLRLIVICLLLFEASAMPAQSAPNQPHSLRIYVNHLESSDQAFGDMVTAKLVSHLVKHGLTVVESEEDADAVLTGSGMMQQSTTEYGHTHFRLHAGMRLVSKDKGVVIWADDVASSKFSESASSSFAENVAKSVEEALNPRHEKQ